MNIPRLTARLLAVLAGVMLCGQLLADTGTGRVSAAATGPTPAPMVAEGVGLVVSYARDNPNADADQLWQFLDASIAPHFDFDYMARWAAGPYLRRLSDEQLSRLGERLRELFVSGLARNLGAFLDPLPYIRVGRARSGRDPREAVVPARVQLPTGLRVRLDFRCYWDGERWRVFDVSANGASAVAYFRRHFTGELRRAGPESLSP